jgi:hypothetical protein
MNSNGNNLNGSIGAITPATEPIESQVSQASTQATESSDPSRKEDAVGTRFATRAVRTADGMSKSKLILLGGGCLQRCSSSSSPRP